MKGSLGERHLFFPMGCSPGEEKRKKPPDSTLPVSLSHSPPLAPFSIPLSLLATLYLHLFSVVGAFMSFHSHLCSRPRPHTHCSSPSSSSSFFSPFKRLLHRPPDQTMRAAGGVGTGGTVRVRQGRVFSSNRNLFIRPNLSLTLGDQVVRTVIHWWRGA